MKRLNKMMLILITLVIGFACRQNQERANKDGQPVTDDDLIRANRVLVKKDAAKIDAFVKRHNWDMQQTETGLWYMVYEKGNGEQTRTGDVAIIHYNISLLDGTECYSSGTRDPKEFKIGQGGVESGLEEGILLLRVGDKARFIMPPHLAHGLIGDNDKIPARAILLYEVELIALKRN
ncbi:MAG: FKBP-type peptidyl-prolyl cis-trans isomerase [Bacteroidales bacterium]|nr:FKBP-type peptidyl-prolyl cis-trans isomerase [Bacteroidales bacterium]